MSVTRSMVAFGNPPAHSASAPKSNREFRVDPMLSMVVGCLHDVLAVLGRLRIHPRGLRRHPAEPGDELRLIYTPHPRPRQTITFLPSATSIAVTFRIFLQNTYPTPSGTKGGNFLSPVSPFLLYDYYFGIFLFLVYCMVFIA